jgi:hypothetical protein
MTFLNSKTKKKKSQNSQDGMTENQAGELKKTKTGPISFQLKKILKTKNRQETKRRNISRSMIS